MLAALKDHPRGCGENGAGKSHLCTAVGSPPRMRGKPSIPVQQTWRHGITPADAGKTQTGGFKCKEDWDHPRGCGENTKKIL